MRTILEYIGILKKKGFRYSFNEVWKRVQRLHWIRDDKLLELEEEYRRYRYLEKYKYVLEEEITIDSNYQNPYPNKIWVCWLQGLEQAPELVKKCVESIQKNSSKYEVIILTSDNIPQYINFPIYIMDKYKKKIITPTHFSDILRIALLSEYGGIWIDSTVHVSEQIPDYISQVPLFCFKSSHLSPNKIKTSSWFIASDPNNFLLIQVRDILYEYWKNENKLRHYFLFHLLFSIVIDYNEKNRHLWNNIPYYNNINPHILQHELFNQFDKERYDVICKFAPVHKLTYKIPPSHTKYIEGTYYEKLLNGELI